MSPAAPRLSICLATRNRAAFISQTLDSILGQLQPRIELVVVDGASSDRTPEVMERYRSLHPSIRYYRQPDNSGVDQDYDKAIGYAGGDYCWMMTDDDVLRPGAIERVLAAIEKPRDLVVVNAEARNADLSKVLQHRLLDIARDRDYGPGEKDKLFQDVASYLSFIGGVVVRRGFWNSRDRKSYYGSLFAHVGVIFQSPAVENASVIADPLIALRYGLAGWTPRSFEIWFIKWPELIWSFSDFPASAKAKVYPREPWRNLRRLFLYRANGAYALGEYRRHLSTRAGGTTRLFCLAIALCPGILANMIASIYCAAVKRSARLELYDLVRCRHATWFTRLMGRWAGI